MANPLLRVPGLGGFLASRQQMQQEEAAELQQMGALQTLLSGRQQMQERAAELKRKEALRTALAASNGDVEKALETVVRGGDIDAAAKLAPLAKIAQEHREREQTRKGLAALLTPETQAPETQAPETQAPTNPVLPAAARDARRKRLNEMSLLYANNATMQAMIQRELGKLDNEKKPDAPSSLGKLIKERDALPIGHPDRKRYDAAIEKFAPGGVNVTLNLGKEGQNKVDTGLLDTTQGLMRLSTIEGQYRPEFQQFSGRLSAGWSALKDKAGVDLSPEDRQFLTDFSAYKRNAINSMNEYIKSITGAAMSELEAQRIIRGMPNPGQGLFDGDSPTEFKAKLDDAIKQTRLALARYEYIKRNGIALSDANGNAVIPLDRMPEIMNQRGRVLEEQFKKANSRATLQEIQTNVRSVLAKEFGLIR